MRDHLARFSASFGVEMNFPTRMQNTRRALAVGELAREAGKQDEFRAAAMGAYWLEGMDLENDVHLAPLVERVGLPVGSVARVDDEARWLAQVDEIRAEATELGVSGIPTFVFGQTPTRETVVVGCQAYDVLLNAARASRT